MLGWKLVQMRTSEEKIRKEISEDSGLQESILLQGIKEQHILNSSMRCTIKEYDSIEKFFLISRLVTMKYSTTL